MANRWIPIIRRAWPGRTWSMEGEDLTTLLWDESNPEPVPTLEQLEQAAVKHGAAVADDEEHQQEALAARTRFEDALTRIVEGLPQVSAADKAELRAERDKMRPRRDRGS